MRSIVVSSIIALVIAALLTAGYFFYRRYSGDVAEAIRAVPPDAAFVIECRNAQTSLFNLSHADYWKKITAAPSMKDFKDRLWHIDSVFSADDAFSAVWKSKPIIISGHVTKATDFDWLYLFEVPRGTNEADVTEMVNRMLSVSVETTKHEYESIFVHELTVGGGRTFSFALHKGIFMCSYTSFLVEDAIRQLKNGTPLRTNKSFAAVYKTAGKNTDANFYFNYKSFTRFLGIYANQEANDFLSLGSSFAEWTEADARFNSTAVLLNGYTSTRDTTQLMAVFKKQQPLSMEMADILPDRTAYLFHMSISDPKTFFSHLQFSSYGGGGGKEEFFQSLKGKSKSALDDNLTSWVANEMALVITESNTANYSKNTFACIEAKDTAEAMKALKEVCAATEPVKGTGCKTERYNGHEIGLIKAEGVVPMVYGKLFEGIQKNYFTTVGNYIVFANQASSLRSFIDDAANKRILAADSTYKLVLTNTETTSNVYIYLNFSRSLNMIRSFAAGELLQGLDVNSRINAVSNELAAMALQFGNKGDLIYNHFVLQFSEESRRNVSLVWAAECDTAVNMKPQLVTDGTDDFFMVQDEANGLYLFDVGGQLIWKKQLDEKIMSDISSIDFFHNGTQQFLFSTASYLYLVDKSGAYMGNYPIRLPATASNGCVAIDFDGNRDYKIFVACTNQMLYAYEANGKAMNGWQYNRPVGSITLPVSYFKVKDKDYLFISTTDGKMELLDKRGALRARVSEKIMRSASGNVKAVDTGEVATAHVLLADTAGNVFAVYTDGRTKKLLSNRYAGPVFFDVADVNHDTKPDYVLFGSRTITVQSADSNLLFTHEFREGAPGLFVSSSGNLVGSIDPEANQLTVYNEDGRLYPGFPVKGSTPFLVTPINKDGKKYMTVASNDGSLYLYVLE